MPASGADFPVILVVQEIFGVHEWIRDVCRRLAKMGYYAIAPALYAREGDPAKLENIGEIIQRIVSKVTDAQVMSDLDATAAYAKSTGKADASKLGITGFCWGGRMVWLYATHNPALKAAVAWYGDVSSAYRRGEKSALQLIPELKAPVLGLYGGKDEGIPVDAVRKAEAAMKAAGKAGEIVVYPQADHGFLADYRPSYDMAAAQDGWKRMSAWFRRYL
jgi:carboxymethylenebutenolidase